MSLKQERLSESQRKKETKKKRKTEKYVNGKFYSGKGYYLDGEFIWHDQIHGKKGYKLGQLHVELHKKEVDSKAFERYCKYHAKRKLSGNNSYEIGIIQKCRENLGLDIRTGKKIEYKEGEYYKGKGYYLDGKFIISHDDPSSYKLGRLHAKRIVEKADRKIIRRVSKYKPKNEYERGKIEVCKEEIAKKK